MRKFNTAAKAAILLLNKDYKVKELAGGIAAWKTMNFPLDADNLSCEC
ncbi:hypothetical protein [Cytobacillus sp. IB215316]|nr:hypothetical protein [Cytobacillus sp. IB215316]MDX8361164.1 hypothetical protein [Cytobacillus sp. IB215316]